MPEITESKNKPHIKFENCISYLIKEKRPIQAYIYFSREINSGRRGLCITREPPGKIKEKYKLPDVQVIWLSNTYMEQAMQPKNLEKLSMHINNFIAEVKGSFILIDCIEYLISNNNFNIILKFIQNIKDGVVLYKSILLISIDPGAFEPQQISRIENDVDVII